MVVSYELPAGMVTKASDGRLVRLTDRSTPSKATFESVNRELVCRSKQPCKYR